MNDVPSSILILDDEENYAEMLRQLLQDAGYEVMACLNAAVALEILQQDSFGLVLADYKMPEMDGADFLRAAREILPDLPVIMVSGFMNTPELLRVANIGVTLVLEKPIKPRGLLQAVRRYVEPPIPSGESEATEAQEADTGPLERESTYPRPLRFLRDACPVAQGWVELFWEAHQAERHLPLVYAPGSCWNAAVREAAVWAGGSPRRVFRVVAAHESVVNALGRLREAMASETLAPAAIAVELAPGEEAWLEAWSAEIGEILAAAPTVRCLYGGHQPEAVALPATLARQAIPVVIPPLRDRLGDLALQTVQFLDFHSGGKALSLSARAIRLLLHYQWPGNEDELFAVIRRLGVMCGEGEIDLPELVEGLERAHAVVDHRLAEHDLNWFLAQRQEIATLRQTG